jgi:iron(III) transport system ATP-binding protein
VLTVKALNTEYPSKTGAPVRAAQNVTFSVPEGKLFTLLGPSGCGKTTTLRSIAGLERPTSGEIQVGGHVVYSSQRNIFVAPNQRNFGMVFQSYAIWPHMNVFENTAFPLQVRRTGRPSTSEIRDKVMRVLGAVGLDHLADREATKLSGGQQQRLALARALVMEPKLLLLDEPLSNLDAKLREKMRFELKRIQRELGLTTIYVTHDQSEALALSHEIAVMNEGQIVQLGSPREIYEKPKSKFVADFIGTTNFLDGIVIGRDGDSGRLRVQSPVGVMLVQSDTALPQGSPVTVSVRPEDVSLSDRPPQAAQDENHYTGTVEAKVFLGEYIDFKVRLGDCTLLARAHPSLRTPIGEPIHVCLQAEKCIAIPDGVPSSRAA